jgi:hypothetical protein
MAGQCQKTTISQQVCYVRFVEGTPDHSDELPYVTARGERLIADFDADGKDHRYRACRPQWPKTLSELKLSDYPN